MYKYFKTLFSKVTVLLLLALILFGTVCYASTWEFKFPTYVTDNTGTSRTYYPVILGYHGQDLINNGYISSSGNDTNMQIGTSSLDYMLSTTNVSCIIENLPAYGKQTIDLYTGFSPQQSGFPIIIGDSGNITVSDAPAMEMGDNFTLTITNAILTTDNASDKNLWYKDSAIEFYVNETTANKINVKIPTTASSETINPTGAGDETNLDLTGAATNWQAVSDSNDGTFVYENGVAVYDRDLYVTGDITCTYPISHIIVSMKVSNEVSNDTYCKPALKINGTVYDGTEQGPVSTSWVTKTQTYTTNPDTGLPWTLADINAMQVGLSLKTTNGGNEARCSKLWTTVYFEDIETYVTGITDGEYSSVVLSANTTHLMLNIDGTSNSTLLQGISVPNNVNDIIIMQGNSFVKADSIELEIDGVAVATYEPTSMLSGATLNDETGTNDGTIIWGTNDNIIISYGAMVSSGLVEADVEGVASFDMPEAPLPTGWFARGTNLSSLPFYDSFSSVALDTGRSVQNIYFVAVLGIAIGIFILVVSFTKSALLAVIASNLVFVGGAASTIVPLWLPFVVIIVQAAIMYLYKQFAY